MATNIDGGSGPSLVQRVLTLTRERILSGEYQPGMPLRIQKLASECGVSLIPVREALRILQAERLVVAVPNKGARVAPLSLQDMRDLYAARILIEADAVRTARPFTPEEAAEVRELLDELVAAATAGDEPKAMELHRKFHFAIYDRTESRWLPYLIDLLWKHAERYQRLSLQFRHDAAHDEHRRVLTAVLKGDGERAAKLLEVHLRTTAHLLEEAYADTLPEEHAATM